MSECEVLSLPGEREFNSNYDKNLLEIYQKAKNIYIKYIISNDNLY